MRLIALANQKMRRRKRRRRQRRRVTASMNLRELGLLSVLPKKNGKLLRRLSAVAKARRRKLYTRRSRTTF